MRVLVLGGLLLALLAVPTSAGFETQTIRLELGAAEIRIAPPSVLQTHHAAWRGEVAPSESIETPTATFEWGTVTVTQYWRNSTVVLRPDTGAVAHRTWRDPAQETFPIQPESLNLFRPRSGHEFTLLVPPASLAEAHLGPGTLLTTNEPGGSLVPPRPLSYDVSLADAMGPRPPNSGWSDVELLRVWSAQEILILIDGWDLRLAAPEDHLVLRTGFQTTFESDLVATESYSFVLLRVHDGEVRFPSEGTAWKGYVTDPYVTWDGPALLRSAVGSMNVGLATQRVEEETLRVEGAFQSWVTFTGTGTAETLQIRAQGRGDTGRAVFVAGTVPLSLPQALGFGAPVLLGTLLMGGIGLRVVHAAGLTRTRAPREPPRAPVVGGPSRPVLPMTLTTQVPGPGAGAAPAARPAPPIETMLAGVRENPLDGEARFQLGIALMRTEQRPEAMRHLDRSFRLSPESLLKFLECPEYAEVRQQPEVRSLLARFHREQYWKIWSSYA